MNSPADNVTRTDGGGKRLSLHFDVLPEPAALWNGSCLAARTILAAATDLLCQTSASSEPVFPLLRHYALVDGGRLVRFQLAEGPRFHDGEEITARDILFSIEKKLAARRVIEGDALARRCPIRALRRTSKVKFEIQCDPAVGDLASFLAELAVPIVRESDGLTTSGLYRITTWKSERIELELNPAHPDASDALFTSVVLLPVQGDDAPAALLARRSICIASQRLAFWGPHEVDASRTLTSAV